MYNVEDLKSRALVESNILKQFILSTNAKNRGEFKPRLDDILIHDYQMANSVTLNVILSNYMVDLAYAVDCIENPLYGGTRDSYFKLVRGLDVTNPNLDDQTRLILDVSDGNGSFKTRDLVLGLTEIWNENLKVTEFVNLDSIWYCKQVVDGHDTIAVVDEMNNFDRIPNPFGENPFDKELFDPDGNPMDVTFNAWLGGDGRKMLNSIVENRFYKSALDDEGAGDPKGKFGKTISNCRYLLCVPNGFYGLESYWDADLFLGFKLYDIGAALPILGIGKDFDFKFCSFHVIGNKDETTLFLAIMEDNGKYHYLYLNESSLDETYGFAEIDSVVVDQLIVPPSDVFSKVEEVRELDTVNIALTDYGFWDIEANTTNNVTYSYRGGKKFIDPIEVKNQDISKLVTPTMAFSANQRAVEYSDDGDTHGIDRIWDEYDDNWFVCRGIEVNPSADQELDKYKKYRSSIVATDGNPELDFFGGTEHFAVYNASSDDPIHILVNLTYEQFANLLFSNSQLTNYFIVWLYDKVVHALKGEYYLYNNHFIGTEDNRGFLANLSERLWNQSFEGLQFQIGREYVYGSETVSLPLAAKFAKVRDVVDDYASNVNTMSDACAALYGVVTDDLGVQWLYDNGGSPSTRSQLTDSMYDLFSKITWPEVKETPFVHTATDGLVGEFPLLAYFRDYLVEHLDNDLSHFGDALDPNRPAPIVELEDGEEARVVGSVQDYIRGKVRTSLVLGGYDPTKEGNDRYPGIDQYIYRNERKLNKVQVRDVMSLTNTLKEVMFGVQSTKFFSQCESYTALQVAAPDDDGNLFTMTQNEAFVALSKLVKEDGATLKVDWSIAREWLFESDPDNCSNENMLKAFVRTQVYRPLFFKHDEYAGQFTSDPSAYKCETTKWFVDHDGTEHQMVFVDWPTSFDVDKVASGLDDSDKPYTISGIKYFNISNKFEYQINYDPVKIVDNKFVVNDVEFYVVRPKEDKDPEDMAVNSIYFNEFQSNTEGQNQVAKVEDNRFTLDGMGYAI